MQILTIGKCALAALLAVVGATGCGNNTTTAESTPTCSPQQIEQEIRSNSRIPEAAKEKTIQEALRNQKR